MKTTASFFAFFASAAIAATLFLPPAFADDIRYTLSWGNAEQVAGKPEVVLSNATQIAAGAYHSLALANGHVYGWGYATNGSLSVPDLQNIEFIAAGEFSGIAIRSDNLPKNYQVWGGTHSYQFQTLQPTNGPYRAGALGYAHGLLITKKGGAVHAWGDPVGNDSTAVDLPNATWTSGFTAVAAGRDFSIGLSDDGRVHVAAPSNDIYKISEIPAAARSNVTAIAAGPYHAMALTEDGGVVVWGAWVDDSGKKSRALLPRGSLGYVTDVPPDATNGIVAISAGLDMCAALTEQGRVVVWGMQNPKNPDDTVADGYSVLTDVPSYADSGVSQIALGHRHVLVLSSVLPPTFAPGNVLPDGNVGEKYSATIPVRANPAATVRAQSALPRGLSLSARGVLSGTPAEMGVYSNLVIVASNEYGTARQTFTVSINDRIVTAPVWLTDSLPVATVGFRYEFQLVASNATDYSATQLPGWVSLSRDGLLSGTPASTDAGVSSYPVFTATNTAGSAINPDLVLAVQPQSADTPPVFGLDSLPDLVVGTPVAIDLLINGASGVSLSGDASAFSVAPDADGAWILSGKPSRPGVYTNFVVVATNSQAKATNVYSVTVFGPPVWITQTVPVAVVETNYSFQLEAVGADAFATADATSAKRLADNHLALSADGLLSGRPTIATNFDIVLTATNTYGATNRTFKFTVSSTPVTPSAYRFLSITPSATDLALAWTNDAAPNTPAIAILVSTTNLLAPWPDTGIRRTNSAILELPKVPTYYRLQAP